MASPTALPLFRSRQPHLKVEGEEVELFVSLACCVVTLFKLDGERLIERLITPIARYLSGRCIYPYIVQ